MNFHIMRDIKADEEDAMDIGICSLVAGSHAYT